MGGPIEKSKNEILAKTLPSIHSPTSSNRQSRLDKKEQLYHFCLNFDPYLSPIPEKDLLFLLEWGLGDYLHDPFRLTQELLLLQEKYGVI